MRTLNTWQEFCLSRLEYALEQQAWIREHPGVVLEPWIHNMVHRVVYSLFRDCRDAGLEDEGKALITQYS